MLYLQGRIEELESNKLCECAEEPVKPTVQYVTNYDRDEECLSCSKIKPYPVPIVELDHAKKEITLLNKSKLSQRDTENFFIKFIGKSFSSFIILILIHQSSPGS